MDNKVELTVQGVANSRVQSNAYALILKDDGTRRLPVIIGLPEAQSIAVALEGMATPRPMTHDLIVGMTHAFRLKLKEVFIYRFEDGVFFSELVFQESDGTETRIDSRTSDAVALALRLRCPIYTFESHGSGGDPRPTAAAQMAQAARGLRDRGHAGASRRRREIRAG